MKLIKKILPIFLILAVMFAFVACEEENTDGGEGNGDGGATNATYTVTFDLNYDGAPEATKVTVNSGDRVAKPTTDPTRSGYDFLGWFIDSACQVEESFLKSSGMSNDPINKITADTTFYAGWTEHVEPVVLVSISAIYDGEVVVNGNYSQSDFAVTATYDDGSSKSVSGFSISAIDSTTAGAKTVTVTYVEEGVTKTFDVQINVVEGNTGDSGDSGSGDVGGEESGYTYYYYNSNGWANVNAYAWKEEVTPVTPAIGDYVIMGLNGDWTMENSIKLFADNNGTQYSIQGLRLPANTAFKIVKLGEAGENEDGELIHGYYSAVETYVSTDIYDHDTNGNIVVATEGLYDFYFKDGSKELYFAPSSSSECTPNTQVSSTHVTDAWPGTAMTAVDGQTGWYSITLTEAPDKIIFNDGTNQTSNITIDGVNYYYNDETDTWQSGFNG